MAELSSEYRPLAVEAAARALWAARRLPPADGTIGAGDSPRLWQFEGTFAPGDRTELIAQRAVAADVDARYLALSARRAVGTLRRESFRGLDPAVEVGPVLAALGVWTGGAEGRPWDGAERADGLQRMASKLAREGLLVVRDRSMRICPRCATPRTPERMVYQEELGPTYLVRFAIRRGEREVHALAWVDAPWRLLGTSALLVNPDLPYVVARHQRRGAEEWILSSRSSIERLRGWLPGTEIEVAEEIAGRDLVGLPYGYPLRHEFPIGGTLTPPAGTLQPSREVGDTGTGIVPLVPGHGGTDAQIAEALGVPGWPLVTAKGQMDLTLMHKYSGLDLRSADEFVVRDLAEGGALFAELRVRRGVPRCAICGTAMVWTPGRGWCLEPGRLPAGLSALFARLLPGEPPFAGLESAWPASESGTATGIGTVQLRECSKCERLNGPDGPTECPCGGRTRVVSRRLLPSIAGAIHAWARQNPIPPSDGARLYVGERRRTPALIHNLVAIAGLDQPLTDLGLTLLPTFRTDDLAGLIAAHGADAVRAALVRSESSTRASAPFADRVEQEHRRLERWWQLAAGVVAACDDALLAAFSRPIAVALRDLEPVDLALVARWERVRLQALADYDRWAAAAAHRRLGRFLDTDLAEYAQLVRVRLRPAGSPPSKQAALRTLVHVLRGSTTLLAPICPHTAEGIHRALVRDGASLFEEAPTGVDRALMDEERARAWDRWLSVVRAIAEFRRSLRIPGSTPLPAAAIVVESDEVGDQYRSALATLESLARVGHLEIGSPRQPWAGRRREVRPLETEIQRAYPSMAAQMIAILRRMPPRTARGSPAGGEFSVVVGSNTYQLSSRMIGYTDTLPERYVPVPWSGGEIYAQLPTALESAAPPPLTPDGFWLVRRIQQRLRRLGPLAGGARPVVIVSAGEPLLGELLGARERIAKFLGLAELRVSAEVAEAAPPGRTWGRTRTGVRWWFHVPGAPVFVRAQKTRRPRGHARRVPEVGGDDLTGEVDYADDAVVAESEMIRTLGQELDGVLGLPLLGPAKVTAGWSAGLRSVDDYGHAPFEQLVDLPGFGVAIAERLRGRLGAPVPARPRRVRTVRRAPTAPVRAVAPPASPTPAEPPSARPEPPAAPPAAQSPSPPSVPSNVATPAPEPSPETAAPPPAPLPAPVEAMSPSEPLPESPAPSPAPPPPEPGPTASAPTAAMEPVDAPTAVEPSPSEAAGPTSPEPLPEPPGAVGETSEAPVVEPPAPGPDTIEPAPTMDGLTLDTEDREIPEVAERTDELPLLGPEAPSETGSAPPTEVPVDAPSVPPSPPETPPGPTPVPVAPVPAAEEAPPVEAAETAPSPPSAAGAPEAPEVGTEAAMETQPLPEEAPAAETPETETPLPEDEPMPAELAVEEPALPPEPAPEPPTLEAAVPPPPSGIEAMVGPLWLPSLQQFLDATAAGHHGLCVVRESPERIRAYVGARPVEVYWLTNLGRGQTLKPGDLDGLAAFLERALAEQQVTAFFFEGVEYLVQLHGIEKLLARLVAFDRSAREHDARAWLHLNPNLLAPADLQRLVDLFGRPAAGAAP